MSLPGIGPEIIEKRISTVFLDGKPVDDIDRARLSDGAILALFASMPGLAGASLRRGGRLASFRGQITFSPIKKPGPSQTGYISVRLFNLLLKELGPIFLNKGVFIESADFVDIITSLPDDILENIVGIRVNGLVESPGRLLRMDWPDISGTLELRVRFVP